MERNGTTKRVRIAADIEQDMIALIDEDRKGKCSRAAIIRMALVDRYQERDPVRTRQRR